MSNEVSVANREVSERSPCVPIAAAFLFGIAAGRGIEVPHAILFGAAGLMLVALRLGRRAARSIRVAGLLAACLAVGVAAGQSAWRDRRPDSVTRVADAEPKLVHLTAIVADAAVVERRRDSGRKAAWLLTDRSRVALDVVGCSREDGSRIPLTGRVQLSSAGHLNHVGLGDRIEVTGWLARPVGPRNPGGFDVATFLRGRGIDAAVYVDHPEAVRRIEAGRVTPRRWLAGLRERLALRFTEHLSGENGAVGTAMLLGDRSAMPLHIRDAYMASGAMHILAISGMNVGIFAVLLVGIGRLLNLSTGLVTVLVVCCAWAYAALTNLEPPVVRASVFLTLWALAVFRWRQASLLNVCAGTALLLAIVNPLLVFDVGARLSFVAVLGLAWSMRSLPRAQQLFVDAAEERPRLASVARWAWATLVLSIGTWVFTAPIIASEFGMISPVGMPLNVVLVPLSTVVMWGGYLFLLACLLAPWAAGPFGGAFDLGLDVVNRLVLAAGEWEFGHVAVPGVPGWWVLGVYGLLFLGLSAPRWAGRRVRSLAVLVGWTACGLGAGLWPDGGVRGPLRVTVLDVGHGAAILLETPSGRRMLYDCGSMEDDRRAAETVWGAIRERGGTMIDLLVVSHADLDHCNNVPALFRGGPVGAVACPRSLLDLDQSIVRNACESARDAGTLIRLLAAGDRIGIDPDVGIEVLHPADRPPGPDDNANSAVVRVTYAGRSILLTGDLEGAGQRELFDRAPAAIHDVVVAPHHGWRTGIVQLRPEGGRGRRSRA